MLISLSGGRSIIHSQTPVFTSEELLFNQMECLARLNNPEAALNIWNDFVAKRYEDYNALTLDDIQKFYTDVHKEYSDGLEAIGLYSFPYSLRPTFINKEGIRTFTPKEAMLLAIWDQRRRELFGSGDRWFEIKRNKLRVLHKEALRSINRFRAEEYRIAGDDLRSAIQIPTIAAERGITPLNPR